MKIVCPRCNAGYSIPSSKIPEGKRATATCKNCGGKIVIEPSVVKQPDHSTQAESVSTPTILPDHKPPQETKKGEQPQLSPSPKRPTKTYTLDQGTKYKRIMISMIRWSGGVILILFGLFGLLSLIVLLIEGTAGYSPARLLVEGCFFGVLPLGLGGLLIRSNIRKRQKSMYHPSGEQDIQGIRLWNPNPIGCWSLFFTPLFGSILTFLNWRALGKDKEAKKALIWIWISVLILVAAPFIPDAIREWSKSSPMTIGGIFLISWYISLNRPQAKYFKNNVATYKKRRWWKPVPLGLLGWICYFILIFILLTITGQV